MSVDLSKYNVRTDLILENIKEDIKQKKEDFYSHTKRTLVKIESDNYQKKQGNYYTIETTALDNHDHDELEELCNVVSDTLKEILKENHIFLNHKALVIGLGNPLVTPDSLGPNVINEILVTRHMFLLEQDLNPGIRNVSSIAPGVMGQTGMETKDIILGVIKETKPDFLIVVDALAALNMDHLCKSIQITDAGINPGSGIGNNRAEISYETVGIPVIAIGVPTVVDVVGIVSNTLEFILKNINNEFENSNALILNKYQDKNYEEMDLPNDAIRREFLGTIGLLDENQKRTLLQETLGNNYNMFVCPKEIDVYINDLKNILGKSLNISLHPAYNRQNGSI